MKPFFVYMLRCADASYYVGHTDELDARIATHQAGVADSYTSTRRPVELVWSQETATREEALAAERQIKGWARSKKEALTGGDWLAIQRHAWGTNNPLPAHLLVPTPPPVLPEVSKDVPTPPPVRPEVSKNAPSPPVRPEVSKDPATPSFDTSGRTVPSFDTSGREVPAFETPERTRRSGELQGHGTGLLAAITGPPGATQRRAIAKAITLLESTRADHRARGDELLNALLSHTGRAFRLGISGVPGVGKSTFIEALGLHLIGTGQRVAVLAVDPSSSVSGGSILGDKTRMERLSVDERAYIRPSPASGTLGGVAEKTRESMLVCEAAGYDTVIVETVGVGQSETAVSGMTDMFVLMQLPNAGDDLQAIKKGVMELADLVLVNKADLDEAAATRARAQLSGALRWLGPQTHTVTQVMQLSALKGTGLADFWHAVTQFRGAQAASGQLTQRRHMQDQAWMWERIEAGLHQRFHAHAAVQEALPRLTGEVRAGRLAASVAARQLLELLG